MTNGLNLDLSPCKLKPYDYQVAGIEKLVAQPYVFLGDEMGCGKSLQVLVAAQLLFQQGVIDKVIVIAPACVVSVWTDKDLGELRKHLFDSMPAVVTRFHARSTSWRQGPEGVKELQIWGSNYEFVIAKRRLQQLEAACGPKTLLVLDEAAYVKSHSSQRTKACKQLRKLCGRVVLLSGTPVANSPLDLFSQANMLHHDVISCKFVTEFRARYEIRVPVKRDNGQVLKDPYGRPVMTNDGWTNLEDLNRRIAPYMLRRLKSDVLKDLPAKLPPTIVTFELTPETWRHYKAMKDDLVVWLEQDTVATARTAAVKVMRLAQITSGFLGGIEDAGIDVGLYGYTAANVEDFFGVDPPDVPPQDESTAMSAVREIGREKLDAFLAWLAVRLEEDPNLKLLVQCRFRAEIARLVRELRKLYPAADVGEIVGGQKRQERDDALRLLDPRTAPASPVVVVTSSAGSLGLNLTAAHTVARLSRDYSLWTWLQGEDRVHRIGQTMPISYTDFVARGPRGQKTVDHVVLEALMAKRDLANQTAAGWLTALKEE